MAAEFIANDIHQVTDNNRIHIHTHATQGRVSLNPKVIVIIFL